METVANWLQQGQPRCGKDPGKTSHVEKDVDGKEGKGKGVGVPVRQIDAWVTYWVATGVDDARRAGKVRSESI